MEQNRMVKKIMLYVQVRFLSPLNVSSGEDEWTDAVCSEMETEMSLCREALWQELCVLISEKKKMNPVCSGIQKKKKMVRIPEK